MEPLVDCSIRLWDQSRNPVFWLSDRTLVRDMLGNYDGLPDTYTLEDYVAATSGFEVRGAGWSDAGATNPIDAAAWVREQNDRDLVVGIVTLADPLAPGFEELVRNLHTNDLVSSVRVRLVSALITGRSAGPDDDELLLERLGILGEVGLVATIEASADQLDTVTRIARRLPSLTVVLDHFGWPDDLSAAGREAHLQMLRQVAAEPNVSTRIDAIGTIFGDWDTATIRPWIEGVVERFGPDRCMLGSDLPIETLRSSFRDLYGAYDDIFGSYSTDERRLLFADTALTCFGAASRRPS